MSQKPKEKGTPLTRESINEETASRRPIEDLSAKIEQLKQENELLRTNASETLARSESIYREVIENTEGVPYRFSYSDQKYEFFWPWD